MQNLTAVAAGQADMKDGSVSDGGFFVKISLFVHERSRTRPVGTGKTGHKGDCRHKPTCHALHRCTGMDCHPPGTPPDSEIRE
ncbi:hypothetical protein AA102526_0729 [Asaia lannensis NBRC 102526]|nr:hypothetical protein AA102526_0729 [Asaia lannensis NBRC 102526]